MKQVHQSESGDLSWKNLYKAGGAGCLIAVALYLADVVLTFGAEGTAPGLRPAIEWFIKIQGRMPLEARNLGFINMTAMICGVPIYLSLFGAHRKVNIAWAALGVMFFLIGTAIYISNNPSISMAVLSGKYMAATSEAQRSLLAAAGEALLAQGEDFTPGAFIGFFVGEIGGLIMAFVMLRGGIFSKVNAYAGIIGFGLLTIFTIVATFAANLFDAVMVFGVIGGVSSIVWYFLTGRKLLQLGKGSF